jgi:hypothetical protein
MAVDLFQTRTLLGVVKLVKPAKRFLLNTFFSKVNPIITTTIDIDLVKGKRTLAPFVSQRIGSSTVGTDGFTTQTYKPPMIAPDYPFSGEDLQTRLPGENIYSGNSPDDRLAVLILNKLNSFEDMIARREEWMVAQTLCTGKIPVVGEGIDQLIDFSFTNKETLATKAKWSYKASDYTGNPIKDLKRWKRKLAKAGFTSTHVIMDTDAADAFLEHPEIVKLFNTPTANLATIAPREKDPDGTTFICRINEIGLDIYSYEEWYIDPTDNEEKPLMPSGTVIMASNDSNATGFTMAYASITDVNRGTFNLSRVPKSWMQEKPSARYLALQSRPLPIPTMVDSWFVGTVL